MKVSVVYAELDGQRWIPVQLAEGATVNQAIDASGILKHYPQIDLAQQKVGIYGKFTQLDAVLCEGDRVEIYRPIVADPKTVPRRPKAE